MRFKKYKSGISLFSSHAYIIQIESCSEAQLKVNKEDKNHQRDIMHSNTLLIEDLRLRILYNRDFSLLKIRPLIGPKDHISL
jgi:hypothetical protein